MSSSAKPGAPCVAALDAPAPRRRARAPRASPTGRAATTRVTRASRTPGHVEHLVAQRARCPAAAAGCRRARRPPPAPGRPRRPSRRPRPRPAPGRARAPGRRTAASRASRPRATDRGRSSSTWRRARLRRARARSANRATELGGDHGRRRPGRRSRAGAARRCRWSPTRPNGTGSPAAASASGAVAGVARGGRLGVGCRSSASPRSPAARSRRRARRGAVGPARRRVARGRRAATGSCAGSVAASTSSTTGAEQRDVPGADREQQVARPGRRGDRAGGVEPVRHERRLARASGRGRRSARRSPPGPGPRARRRRRSRRRRRPGRTPRRTRPRTCGCASTGAAGRARATRPLADDRARRRSSAATSVGWCA